MEHLKIFIDLTRLNKPIGFMLLFWPCSWGLVYAYNFNQDLNTFEESYKHKINQGISLFKKKLLEG